MAQIERLSINISSFSQPAECRLNISDYIREAARTLKLDGQLWIYEIDCHIKNLHQFTRGLELAGFRIIENIGVWKFRYIRAIKSEEVMLSHINIQL